MLVWGGGWAGRAERCAPACRPCPLRECGSLTCPASPPPHHVRSLARVMLVRAWVHLRPVGCVRACVAPLCVVRTPLGWCLLCAPCCVPCVFVTHFPLHPQNLNLLSRFSIADAVCAGYLQAVEEAYLENPYHNALHGGTCFACAV